MRLRSTLLLLALAIGAPAAAQTRPQSVWSGSIGYAADDKAPVEGITLTGSYARLFGFFRPALYVEGIAYQDEDSRYYYDSFDNGDGRCRDSETGRFVESSLCAASWQLAVRGEGLVRVPRTPLLVGPGLRVGAGGWTPYGTVMYEAPLGAAGRTVLQFKGSAGRQYIQGDLGIGFAL